MRHEAFSVAASIASAASPKRASATYTLVSKKIFMSHSESFRRPDQSLPDQFPAHAPAGALPPPRASTQFPPPAPNALRAGDGLPRAAGECVEGSLGQLHSWQTLDEELTPGTSR